MEKERSKKLKVVNSKYIDHDFLDREISNIIEHGHYLSDYKPDAEELKSIKSSLDGYFELEIRKLYRTMSAEKAFKLHGEENVMAMLARMYRFEEKFYDIEIEMDVTEEELDRFIEYSYDREEDLKFCDDEMTGNKFLKLCRLCYDSAPKYPFPKDVSDFYVYTHMKGGNLDHEYYHVLSEDIDMDSPSDFVKYHHFGYHTEELKFGGPCIGFRHPFEKKSRYKWQAYFYQKGEDPWRAIKMYLALRDKGYPVTILEPEGTIRDYLMSSKVYGRSGWRAYRHYVKSAEEAIKLADELEKKGK